MGSRENRTAVHRLAFSEPRQLRADPAIHPAGVSVLVDCDIEHDTSIRVWSAANEPVRNGVHNSVIWFGGRNDQ